MSRWGRDHWSLLAYLETRDVDYGGHVDWDQVTLSAANWPALYAARSGPVDEWPVDAAQAYPLQIKDEAGADAVAHGHCEGDALADLIDHALITVRMPATSPDGSAYLRPDGRPLPEDAPRPGPVTGFTELTLMAWAGYRLTPAGRRLAGQLREHRASSKPRSAFAPRLTPSQRMVQRLRDAGVDLPPDAAVRRTFAGPAQRNEGAWSWTVTNAAGTPLMKGADGRPFAVGSQWPLAFLLRLPHLLINAESSGDVHVDPPTESLRSASPTR
jgi:hypothetical protein